MSNWEIKVKRVPPLKVASIQAQGLPFKDTVPRAFEDLYQWMESNGLPMPKGSPMGLAIYYGDPKASDPSKVAFKVAIPVPEETPYYSGGDLAVEMLPGYEVAYLTYLGPYTNLEEAYRDLFGWIYSKGYKPIDAPREVYVKWEEGMAPEGWETEIQVPIGR